MKNRTVTQGAWSAVTVTCNGVTRAEPFKLRRFFARDFAVQKGDLYGKEFKTREEAYEAMLEHGYTQEFVIPWCQHCREQHRSSFEIPHKGTDGKTYWARSRIGFCQATGKSLYSD